MSLHRPEINCQMASCLCSAAIPRLETHSYPSAAGWQRSPLSGRRFLTFQCRKSNSPADDAEGFSSENAVLRAAWYGSELLGIVVSYFRRPAPQQSPPEESTGASGDGPGGLGIVDRARVVEAIKEDFRRSYFVTGNLTLSVYDEDCEFADPAGSFRGLGRFKRNCSNFGSLLEKSNMKLMKWEEYELPKETTCCRIRELGIGVLAVSCHFLGGPFFLLLGTQSTTLMPSQERSAGMWSTGMSRKWLFLSKFSNQADWYGIKFESLGLLR